MEEDQDNAQAQHAEEAIVPERKKIEEKPAKKPKHTSPTAWALLITVLLGFGFLAAANMGLIYDFFPNDSYPPQKTVGMGEAGEGSAFDYLGIWVQVLAISIVVTAVSATITMFAILIMSANLSNLSESIDEIKEELRNK